MNYHRSKSLHENDMGAVVQIDPSLSLWLEFWSLCTCSNSPSDNGSVYCSYCWWLSCAACTVSVLGIVVLHKCLEVYNGTKTKLSGCKDDRLAMKFSV